MSESGKKNALKNLSNGGSKHWNWRGGITKENHLIRNTAQYKEWRMSVFRRDKFRCVLCGYRSVKKRDIRADHIKPFSKFPELRFVISNGRTLCVPCDIKNGWQLFREQNPRKRIVTN
jgi:5-methylcytosine-specific restriction endonuclease McrA